MTDPSPTALHASSIVIDAVCPLVKDDSIYLDWYREGGVTALAPTVSSGSENARETLDRLAAWHRDRTKNTGQGEFAVPASQLDAIQSERWGKYRDEALAFVPVNYLATLDLTGGNSGSAVLDARGELIGLAFDTSLDSVISDWGFNVARTRGIVVDPRYILWQLDVVDQARELLTELGVQQ